MVVKELYVEKFRKLNDFRLPLGKNITIISGHNGTMKSTILGLLMQPFDVVADSEKKLMDKEYFKTIHGKYTQSKFSEHFKLKYPEYDQIGGLQASVKLYEGISEEEYKFETILRSQEANSLRIWKKGDRSSGSGYIKDIPVIYLDMGRLYPLQNSKYQLDDVNDFTNKEVEFFESCYNKVFKTKNIKVKDVKPLITKMHNKSSLGFITEHYDYTAMSAGEDSVANIIASIISVIRIKEKFDLNRTKFKGAIILIDEIDASLHPPVQRNLMDLLNSVSNKHSIQFVITSHSVDLIEWAYGMREKNIKNSKTIDNVNVAYLVNTDQYVNPNINPELNSLVNHLKLRSHNKVSVFTEDKEAAILIKLLLENSVNNKINIQYSSLSCSVLRPMILQKDFILTDSIIICLDGDERDKVKNEMKSMGIQSIPNLIVLPGNENPEKYIYDFLEKLPSKSRLWENPMESDFHKDCIIQNAPGKEKFKSHSEECQKWFRELFENIIPDEKLFYEVLYEENSGSIDKFNKEFIEGLKFVGTKNLTLPTVNFEIEDKLNDKIKNNSKIRLLNDMFQFAMEERNNSFHPRDYKEGDKYERLTVSDKRIIHQMFNEFFVPEYFKLNYSDYRFYKNI